MEHPTDTQTETAQQLHGPLTEGHWWACEHPERPIEFEVTHFDIRCDPCTVAFDAFRRSSQEDPWLLKGVESGGLHSPDHVAEQARRYREARP